MTVIETILFYILENGSLWDIIFGYLIKTQFSSADLKTVL